MAINRLQYPIEYDEVLAALQEISDEILDNNQKLMICGDPRPELLHWAIRKLKAAQAFEGFTPSEN